MKGLHGILLPTVRPVCLLNEKNKTKQTQKTKNKTKKKKVKHSMIFLSMNSDGKD